MSDQQLWYAQLIKPAWAPPSWLFGPVWTVLYVIIAISFFWIFYQFFRKNISAKIALPFLLNLIFNFSFTPIQFGIKSNLLAAIDIILVLGTLAWGFAMIWKESPNLRWIIYVNIPYLLWALFATILQLSITLLNI